MRDPISVLLIEDDPDHQDLITGYLEMARLLDLKYQVEDSLQKGIDRLKLHKFDLVISDLSLPDSEMSETLPKLLDLKLDIPVVVMTSLDDPDTILSMIQAGASDCVPKIQLNSNLLERTIQYNLDRFRDRKALVQLKEDAELANRMKSEFLATMSHELKTPLNAIIGFSDFLMSCEMEEEYIEMLDAIYTNGKHLSTLVTDILDYSRMDAGKFELSLELIDLEDVVREILQNYHSEAEKKGISLENDLKGLKELVLADPVRIRTILNHLISNAVKFTDKGFVKVSTSVNVAGVIEFIIEDTGIGIKEENYEVIFKPFQQLDSRIDRQHGGTGLGLAICKKLVALMGGEIYVKSVINKGTEIHFNLPSSSSNKVAAKSVPRNKNSHTIDANENLGLKVLVVDDFTINYEVYSKYLQLLGCHAVMADSVDQAMELLRTDSFDVILMDVVMPSLSGFELTKLIRDCTFSDSGKNQYIIGQTTRSTEQDIEMCMQSGMNDYLSKPVSFSMMRDALQRYQKFS